MVLGVSKGGARFKALYSKEYFGSVYYSFFVFPISFFFLVLLKWLLLWCQRMKKILRIGA